MDRLSVMREPVPGVGFTIAATTSAANSPDQKPGPTSVMVWGEADFYIEVGENAVATPASTAIPAGTPFFLPVLPGTGAPWRVSVLQISAGGAVHCKAFV
jgi:hypothetical protein